MSEIEKVYRIFISSCKRLLEQERNTLCNSILDSGHLPIQMENNFIGSSSDYSIDIDKEKIEKADCVIFILSHLYGEEINSKIGNCTSCPLFSKKNSIDNCKSCHKHANNNCQLSFTEFEYEYAKKLKKPIVVIFNENYANDTEFEKINKEYSNITGVDCKNVYYGNKKENDYFFKKATTNHSYPYKTKDDFKVASYQAIRSVIQKIHDQEDESVDCYGLIPYVNFHETNKKKEEIEIEFHILQKNGIETIFDSQAHVFSSLSKEKNIYLGKDGKIVPIRILAIRGISFVEMGREWRQFILDDKYKDGNIVPVEFILGNECNDELIKGRYDAFKDFAKNFETFKSNYKNDMSRVKTAIQNYNNPCKLYLHNESRLPFRMIFIGEYLYLSSFIKDKQARNVPVMKISSSSSLYQVCEEYYNWIKSSSDLVIEK